MAFVYLDSSVLVAIALGDPRGAQALAILGSRDSCTSALSPVGTDFNQAGQLFFDQIVEAAMADEGLRQAAAVNPSDKFELVFKQLLDPKL